MVAHTFLDFLDRSWQTADRILGYESIDIILCI